MMKKYFLFFFILFSSIVFSQNTIKVKGKILNCPKKSFRIETFIKGSFNPMEVTLNNNEFEVSLPVDDIEFYKFIYSDKQFTVLLAEPKTNVEMSVDVKDILNSYNIVGSIPTKQVYENEKKLLDIQNKQNRIQNEFKLIEKTASQDELIKAQFQFDSLKQEYNQTIVSFITSDFSNPASLFFIEKLNADQYLNLYVALSEQINKKYPKNSVVQNFVQKTISLKANAIGSIVSNIKLPDANGDTISLFPLTGKLTVIDFWASWCSPCRKHNPIKVLAYEKFKDKGLVMYSISLDQNGTSWKNAIQQDKLNWKNHVSELKGWQSSAARQFGVSSIPANFIIDEHGKILAKNIREEEYLQFLENFFSK